MEEVDIL